MPRKGRDNYRRWMPMYWGDYLTETHHFTRAEHGSYLLLLAYYWCNKGLPDTEEEIRQIAKCPKRDWPLTRSKLIRKFEISVDLESGTQTWTHSRCNAELAQAFENKQRADHTAPHHILSKKEPKGRTQFANGKSGRKSVMQAAREYMAELEAEEQEQKRNGQENSSGSRH